MAGYKIAIIGSGPAGLSAAGRAEAMDRDAGRTEPSYVLLESRLQPSETIFRFQKGKHVMAEPGYLKLRSDLPFGPGKREAIIGEWDAHIASVGLNIQLDSEVTGISGESGAFKIALARGDIIMAENVVLAIGLQGNPRLLDVPGGTSEWVQYTLDDPEEYEDEEIIVVGSGDAAAENALGLAIQNNVTILNRRDEFARVKDGNQTALLEAFNNPHKSLSCRYTTHVEKIEVLEDAKTRLQVSLNTPDGIVTVGADRIIARLGAIPPRQFLEKCGICFPSDARTALPELSERYESNVPGLRIIGSLAGYPLIKQALNQGHDVVEFIFGNLIKPADHELLAYQFEGLPWEEEVEACIKMMMQRVPMFRQLNTLAFRELVIESHLYANYAQASAAENSAKDMALLNARIAEEYANEKALPNTTRIVEMGQLLYEMGDRGVSFFTVLDGEVTLESPHIPGGSRTLRQGEFFGEMSLIAGQPRPETARAGRNCIVMETPRRTILKLMNSNPLVRDGIVWIYTVRELQRHFVPNATVDQLHEITEEVIQHTFSPGEVLWKEGTEAGSVHIIQNGTVALSKVREGENLVVAQVRGGELLGEMSVFGDATHDETATAKVFTETLEISRALFRKIMRFDVDQVERVQEIASNRLLSRATWEVQPESKGLLQFLLDDGLGEATNVLFIDENLCVGCDNCEKACAETHDGISRLDRKAGNTYGGLLVPNACRHCQQPYCMKDCPPNAINRSSTGEVYIDSTCIGCGNCEANCPYDAIKLTYDAPKKPSLFSWMLFGAGPGPGEDNSDTHSKPDSAAHAVKCDACYTLPNGPACVAACPTGAAFRIAPDPVSEVIGRSA